MANFLYAHISPEEVDQKTATYGKTIMEMFEVSKIKKDFVELVHFFDGEVYAPVRFEEPLRPLLQKGDVFLLTMGFKDGAWEVIWVSPPFSEEFIS